MIGFALPESRRDLGDLLSAHVRAQTVRSTRLVVLHLLVLAGGACWLLSEWPGVLHGPWHVVARIGWPVGFAVLVVLAVWEWRSNIRMLRLTRDERRG